MTNQERRELLNRFRTSGMEGSILDVYAAAKEGRDIISEHQAMQEQQAPLQAITPQEQQEGLRPYHAAGETDRSMVFKDVPPNTPFNTMGMKRPINIEKVDKQGHLIESHKSVPPGLKHVPTGPYEGDVIETPADGYRDGGFLQEGGFTEGGEIDNTLDVVTLEHYLADTRGQEPEFWRATADTLSFHESGPHQRMDPQAVQVGGGPGRGMLQFEPDALETAKNRYEATANKLGFDTDPEIMSAKSADELSKDKQYVLFYSDLIQGPADLKMYADGKMKIVDLWLKGHKKKEAKGDRESFEESRQAAKTGLKEFGLKMGGVRQKWRRSK
tara:strand:+ start:3550 stop:4536 length:987 start_codon:yes stop_codon:yes gene_type:complete